MRHPEITGICLNDTFFLFFNAVMEDYVKIEKIGEGLYTCLIFLKKKKSKSLHLSYQSVRVELLSLKAVRLSGVKSLITVGKSGRTSLWFIRRTFCEGSS